MILNDPINRQSHILIALFGQQCTTPTQCTVAVNVRVTVLLLYFVFIIDKLYVHDMLS